MQPELTLASPAARGVDIDRWFFTSMTALLALVAVVGFAPRSAAIVTGAMPNPPLSVHVHAALMCLWLGLLVAQSGLIAGRLRLVHATLGLASLVLVPAILATMVLATLDTYALMQAAGAGGMGSNILLLQIRSVLLFATFFIWGFRTRHTDSATHKRMMLMCTFVVIDAALARMNWLPGNDITVTINWTLLYQCLLLLPALLYDRLHLGRVHPAWLLGMVIYLPFMLLTSLLWHSPGWHELASGLLGY